VVAACVATVVAVALATACVVVRGASGTPGTGRRWGSSLCRQFNRRSAANLAAATGNGDGDYIYRPLGTGTGSRLDEEYETTFVGVSVPLLHDVRAV